eukprot:8384246-Alexandrium_andersonii.AAC.1
MAKDMGSAGWASTAEPAHAWKSNSASRAGSGTAHGNMRASGRGGRPAKLTSVPRSVVKAVSYTHLTLPTICSV